MSGLVTFHGAGAVWNPVKQKVLCRFVDGIYQTSDPDEIAILAKTFAHDLPPLDEPEDTDPVDGEPVKRPRGRPRNA